MDPSFPVVGGVVCNGSDLVVLERVVVIFLRVVVVFVFVVVLDERLVEDLVRDLRWSIIRPGLQLPLPMLESASWNLDFGVAAAFVDLVVEDLRLLLPWAAFATTEVSPEAATFNDFKLSPFAGSETLFLTVAPGFKEEVLVGLRLFLLKSEESSDSSLLAALVVERNDLTEAPNPVIGGLSKIPDLSFDFDSVTILGFEVLGAVDPVFKPRGLDFGESDPLLAGVPSKIAGVLF